MNGEEENRDDDLDIRAQAESLAGAVGQKVGQAESMLREKAREQPYLVVGAALGLGFILGGGLSGRLLGTVGMIAGRAALSTVVNKALAARAETLGDE